MPFVVVGHALRVFWSPYAAGVRVVVGRASRRRSRGSTSGLAALLLLGAFRGTDESYLEAARQFGASTGRLTRDILVPMARAGPRGERHPDLLLDAGVVLDPAHDGRGGGGPQMLMIDVYYRFGQHGDFATASALGVVAYLLAMGAALVYVRRLTR